MGRISSVVVALLLLLVELVVGVRLSLLDGPVRKRGVSQALPEDLEQCRSVPTHPKLKKISQKMAEKTLLLWKSIQTFPIFKTQPILWLGVGLGT